MKIRARFLLNPYGVRSQILLDQKEAHTTDAILSIVQTMKPPGTEVFVGESRGRAGRRVIWIFDRNPYTASTARGRQAERRWRKAQLIDTLNRIGGKFLRTRGRTF